MKQPKPILHGRDHAPGGADPIPGGTGGAAGVTSLAKSGSTPLTGDVTLSAGTNVTLTQTGQDIAIAAAAAAANVPFAGFNGVYSGGPIFVQNAGALARVMSIPWDLMTARVPSTPAFATLDTTSATTRRKITLTAPGYYLGFAAIWWTSADLAKEVYPDLIPAGAQILGHVGKSTVLSPQQSASPSSVTGWSSAITWGGRTSAGTLTFEFQYWEQTANPITVNDARLVIVKIGV